MATFDASKLNFQFMKYRKILVGLSLVCIVASIALLCTKGLNLGVDFTGGLVLQVKFDQPTDIANVRSALSKIGQGNATIQAFDQNDVLLRFQAQDEQVRKNVLAVLSADIGGYKILRVDKIGPVVGKELRAQAGYSLFLALAGILIYMAYRFRLRFGAAAVAALMHDVILMLGAYSLTGKEISVTFIAAVLTVAGYSLNDSIVVLDRIRENWGSVRSVGIEKLVNTSVNQTLSRTINTSVTTLLPVMAMFLFGGEVISNFAFAFLVGIAVGTYSSIYIASSLLVEWYSRSPKF
ncbi:protein translocase subunit SecF [Synergistes jonesii]|uniref:Protein-export membrane protein SecF n=1 Tax=Synergistes jonesii TaxID=2754 RepID=A0A073ISD0_9BACT|nr:protein translocase subunit SecF [Synergistes jonesii]KEJ92450.1 preprotein translocase subunit SecF [Synergistes jonesii]OFB61626.1 preprotein translocase subunit SecF [Synergistes jonesii]OFB63119.1 preprotein translocase subunit SecF [Synergistes jonesii]OFB63990.1 preprotein translocase subunit SecF [Synergistes jonesii]OFB67825.1 preprotein translocase subunit SecF [Synergistes jonesii]